jgi:anti-sigma B factor antagonist
MPLASTNSRRTDLLDCCRRRGSYFRGRVNPARRDVSVDLGWEVTDGSSKRTNLGPVCRCLHARSVATERPSLTVEDGADVLRASVRQLVRQGRVKMVLNLRGTPYIDSTALGEIVPSYTSAMRQGGGLKLLHVTARVHELLIISRLLWVFDLFDDEAEAVKSFGAMRLP